MDDKFTLVWSFRNRLDVFKESILTADKTCPKNVNFCLIDANSDSETIRDLRNFCNNIRDRSIRVCESFVRSTLCEAWNLGIMLTNSRYIIFTSSDTIFLKQGWLNAFQQCTANNDGYVLMRNHSLFLIDRHIIPTIGWFDEMFACGPHFDPDYMIRASEKGINVKNIPNHGYYSHQDDIETTKQRLNQDVENRLPMNTGENDTIFKEKWLTSWDGWTPSIKKGLTDLPHPPTHISQVRRLRHEIDPHPLYTKKYQGDI